MKRCMRYAFWVTTAIVVSSAGAATDRPAQNLIIPELTSASPRRITIEDLSALRRIDTLRLSPDHRRFAILVRQADAGTNSYRMGWFVGSTQGGSLIPVGDGGEARLAIGVAQSYNGFERAAARWSPDGRWLAYTVARAGEIQLWRSRTDGSAQQQITHNAADVREFEWSKDGKSLYFTAGTGREELRAQEEAKERSGYHYDTDFRGFTDLMGLRAPPVEKDAAVWVVTSGNGRERLASEAERGEFKDAQALSGGGFRHSAGQFTGAFAERADGAQARARMDASNGSSFVARIEASLSGPPSDPIRCAATECSGVIEKVWWGDDNTVLFLRREGLAYQANGLYAWTPASDVVSVVVRTLDDALTQCELVAGMRMICVRETPALPPHVAFVDSSTGGFQTLADVNPEFRNITLGKVERFEWDTPKFKWNEPGGQLERTYADRAYGYILFPPDFNPAQKYPVFISPYAAAGFDNATNREYALHAMAANGFVVLSTNFPQRALDAPARIGRDFRKLDYSAELGFPHLSMYMESTVRALDTVTARGFVDDRRVGIGGVSNGAFVPLYMVQKHDRIAAVSIAGGTWSHLEYYWGTQRGQQTSGAATGSSWFVKPVGPGLDYWKQIELADNVEAIEAPILINTPATETYSLIRLMKHMAEAGKPYDAYVFPKETHIKWQAAHLRACMQRNLDWFRFWLQSYDDPDPSKAEQYSRWRKLRELHEADRARAGESGRGTQLKQQPSAASSLAPN